MENLLKPNGLSFLIKMAALFCQKFLADTFKTTLGIFLLVLLCQGAAGQDYRKYQEEQRRKFEKAKAESASRLDQLRQDFWEYRDKRNAAFANYIKNSWEEYQTLSGLKPPGEPKPDIIPSYTPRPQQEPLRMIDPVDIKPILPDVDLPELVIFPDFIPDLAPMTHALVFDFYGQALKIEADKNLILPGSPIVNESDIAAFWTNISSAD